MMQIDSRIEDTLKRLGTDPHRGLTTKQVRQNRKKYGSNELSPPEKDPLWKQYLDKFKDPTIIILSACAFLALLTGIYELAAKGSWLGILEGVAILIAVAIATGVGFILEYKADQAFELLRAETENVVVKVTRDGAFHTVLVNDVVVGDIVHLGTGDKIPGDGLIIEGTDLQVDQSLWNGELIPASKDKTHDPVLVGGTDVVEGHAAMIVKAVGDNSERGKIEQKLTPLEQELTPLEQKLNALADIINIAGTGAAALIFASIFGAGIMRGELGGTLEPMGQMVLLMVAAVVFVVVIAYSLTKQGREKLVRTIIVGWGLVLVLGVATLFIWGAPLSGESAAFNNFLDNVFSPLLRYFILAVTIIVVAVPEGLPLVVVISLALSARKIRQDNVLVRKMVATETLGYVTVICSDKTGTLTLNRMSVEWVYLHGQLHKDDQVTNLTRHPAFERMALIAARNSTSQLEEKSGELKFVGNHTECALLKWLRDQGVAYEEIRERVPRVAEIPFNPKRKMMSTIVSHDGHRLVLSKGAPERIISRCTQIEVGNGRVEPIEKHQDELNRRLDEMTRLAMRPLALAYKSMTTDEDESEEGLTFLTLIGISDPVREDVPQAVQTCKAAGINVVMVTGDRVRTANVVAKEIGLLEEDSVILEGEEFACMSDEQVLEILPRLRVLARSTPRDKERLVRLLQSLGEVVAVTGDGMDDAPPLTKADVGISMGIRGTDIAKQASDIVLTDDNFGSIVRAVHWGRTLYENVQKFLQFQLTINFSALAIAFLSPLLNLVFPYLNFKKMPLTVLQLLWINLIMDTLAALALGLEPPRPDIMKEPPKRRDESFVTRAMLENILVMGGYFTIVLLVLQATNFLGVDLARGKQFASVLFTTYVFFQVFNEFNARSVKPERSALAGVLKSRSFLTIVAIIIVVQIGLTHFGGSVFNTAPLSLWMWVKILLLTSTGIIVGGIFRFIRRSMGKPALDLIQL